MRVFLSIILLLPALAQADEAIVGDWSTDAGSCASARVTYTADGRHEGLSFEEGQWLVLASGSYRIDGDRLVVRAGDVEDRLVVLSVDAEQLVLRNEDEARMRAMGIESVRFVRCPPR